MPAILGFPPPPQAQPIEQGVPIPPPIKQYWELIAKSEGRQSIEQQADAIMQDLDSCFKYSKLAIIEKIPTDNEVKKLEGYSDKNLRQFGLLKILRVNYTTVKWELIT